MKNKVIILMILLFFVGCNKSSEKKIIGVYTSDKVPLELSDEKVYHYLILDENNIYHLKYNDVNKKRITGSWKLLDSKNDTLNVQFHFSNKNVIGKLKGNIFLFEKPNVFDQRFSSWLYVKTNLERHKIIK